jgi:hypothetical protein
VGADPDAPWIARHVPLHAHEAGFDLHAPVYVAAGDRVRLERLCRYLVRPPLGQQRLHRLRDGRVALALQRSWADGTTHLVFTPAEFLARLVPLVPRPRINLLLYPDYRLESTRGFPNCADPLRASRSETAVNWVEGRRDRVAEGGSR